MSDIYIEGAIPLAEVAKLTGRKVVEVEAEAVELGLFVGQDWAGRPAIADEDAHQLVSGSARRTREDEVAWATHLDACASWTTARDNAVREAQRDTELAAQRAGRGGPAAASAGLEAARAVGREFETSTPPPQWGDEPDGNARRLYSESGRPRLLDRARDLFNAGAPR